VKRSLALASAAGAIAKRDFLLFASYRTRFISTFFTGIVGLTLFYYVSRLVHSPRIGSPDQYFAFVVVGLIIFGVLTSALSTPLLTLRAEQQAGTLERLVLSAFGPVRSVASLLLFPVGLAMTTALTSLVFAGIVFGLKLHWSTVPLAIPLALLGALSFAPFGLIMASAVVVVKQTTAGASVVITAITLLAGIYFPVELLPGWIRWVSDVQPFTPAVDMLRHVLVNTPLRGTAFEDVAKLVGFAVVMTPVSLWILTTAVKFGRRRGTIIEY
jgi:ABC-2 type transport system permease protein